MPRVHTIHVGVEHDGRSVGTVVKHELPHYSWARVRHLIRDRRVRLDGQLCADPGASVARGQRVTIALPPSTPSAASDVRVVFVDEHLVVVEKPPGMVTTRREIDADAMPGQHPTRYPALDEAVERILAAESRVPLAEPDENPGSPSPGSPGGGAIVRVVHRLDRDTSGLMILARCGEAETRLRDMFARHEVQRTYLAVAHGRIEHAVGVRSTLVRDRGDGLRGSVNGTLEVLPELASPGSLFQGNAGGTAPSTAAEPGNLSRTLPSDRTARSAATHIFPIEHLHAATVVRCQLETGRTHQIRIHLSELRHRLCGEPLYTHAYLEAAAPDDTGAPRQALHSAELSLAHPITGEALTFQCPLPPDLERWLTHFRARSHRS